MRTFQVQGDQLTETDTPAVVLSRQANTRRLAELDTLLPTRPASTPAMPHKDVASTR